MIGQTLNNRYTITARLGKGAMGTVYRATDAQSQRDVALKVISSELVVDPDMLERFKREGEALSKLKHPNIVGFIDAFQYDEHYVIVMEYVSGGSLHDLIKAGPLLIEQTRQIALDLCDALIRAHRLNIIHRDLKPENTLIDDDGTPKLADFGVARLSEGTRMTRSGTQVGTPYYMSPEAWEGKTLDFQADIWSLGVILFEMLTGQVPFGGDTGAAVMNKVLTTPPPDLKKLRAEVPSGLVKIVIRMLTRDKKRRYQTMRQVAVDLESDQQRTTPVPTKTRPNVQDARKAPLTRNAAILSTLESALPKTLPFLRIAGFAGIAVAIFGIGLWVFPKVVSLIRTPAPPTQTSTPAFQIGSTIISDKDRMILLYVPAGEFTMGRDNRGSDEKPMHTVYLDAYWIDKTEVTNAMYAQCVQDGKCSQPTHQRYYNDSTYANHPVVYVSWEDANAYCSWANRRLPTEAEWEKAASWDAKNQTKYVYPWGISIPNNDLLNYNNAIGATTEVGTYPNGASPYGALDMAGNVWEWVADWYDANYYATLNARNPQGPASGQYRVLRGGSWGSNNDFVRSAFRGRDDPSATAFTSFGFRCSQSESSLPTATQQVLPNPTQTGQATLTITPELRLDIGSTITFDKDGMTLVYVPSGDFIMGASPDMQANMLDLCENCNADSITDQNPQRSIFLDAFWMYKTEVTIAQFQKFVESESYITSAEKKGSSIILDTSTNTYITQPGVNWLKPDGNSIDLNQFADHPVTHISWEDARSYCSWAGGRLPTEAEWEKTARSMDGRFFPWGNAVPNDQYLNFDLVNDGPVAVTSYPAGISQYGAYDMAGNVWEWVNDYYAESYDPNETRNPAGPLSGDGHVLRGGSWASELDIELVNVMTTFRFYAKDDFTSPLIGFRCAYSPFN